MEILDREDGGTAFGHGDDEPADRVKRSQASRLRRERSQGLVVLRAQDGRQVGHRVVELARDDGLHPFVHIRSGEGLTSGKRERVLDRVAQR